jgi:glycosyltransferase involved in cell wall biosynthesis
MKIFITIPWFVPAFRAGGPIQSVANLVANYTEGVEYFIFCGNTDLNGETLQGITTGEWTTYNDCTKVWYAGKENLGNSICEQIEHVEPDVLFIIGLFSWHYNIVPMLFCKAGTKIISVRGMLHPGALSQKKWKKRFFLQMLKARGTLQYTFHATDAIEAEYIHQQFGKDARVSVAGNFSKKMDVLEAPPKTTGKLHLVTIALISPMKNHLLVLEALQHCTASIHYNIYGPVKDEAYWQQCILLIAAMPENITVQYHGELLPDAVATVLMQHHVFIMPSKSENFGHAIAEALAAGKPVITSHNTPWNDLGNQMAGSNVGLTAPEITTAIDFFAAQTQLEYEGFAAAAVQYAKTHLHTEANKAAYHQLFLGRI